MKLTRYVCQNCHRSLVFPSRAKFLSVKCPGCGTIVELNPPQPESDPPAATPPPPPPEPPTPIDDDAEVELGAEFEFAGRDLADDDAAPPATEFDLAPELEIDIADIDISDLGGTSIDAADIDLAEDDLAPTLSDIDFAELNAEPDAEFDFAEPDTDLAADFDLEPLDAEIKLPAIRDVDLLGDDFLGDDLLDDDLLESTLPAGSSLPHRGNLGEPYCSDECYAAAGRDIALANLQAYSGPCGFCEQPVTLGTGSGNFAHPFRKLLLYICPDCRARGETHARNLQECCFCGKHL